MLSILVDLARRQDHWPDVSRNNSSGTLGRMNTRNVFNNRIKLFVAKRTERPRGVSICGGDIHFQKIVFGLSRYEPRIGGRKRANSDFALIVRVTPTRIGFIHNGQQPKDS
jgi:hypothetical protein